MPNPPSELDVANGTCSRVGRERRWRRRIFLAGLWTFSTLLLLSCILVLWLRNAAKDALPQLDGDIHLTAQAIQGIAAPVTVRRDQHGVTHIDEASQEDILVEQRNEAVQESHWKM